ncbi:amidohydrolase family protein [Desertibaculum subflavum]|uniref:amidohydrolase family protein n=1 Tax=Desertibaculum subflavum TaxID=2268458 RepID=UPI000E66F829
MDGGSFFGLDRATGCRAPPDMVKARLERCGATRALVGALTALQYDTATGNDETLALCRRDDFFLPQALLNPAAYRRGDGLVFRLKQNGFAALGVFPHWPGNGGDFDDLSLRHIAEDAARANLPLFVGLQQRTDFAKVARNLAPAGGALALRWMRGSGYTVLSEALAIARDHTNVHLDIAMAVQTGMIEMLVRELGADRLFLAGNAPFAYEACPYYLVHAARIEPAARQAIQDGTLARLLRVPPTAGDAPADFARLMAAPKIDTLYNIGSFDVIEPEADDAAVAESIARFGAEIAITSSMRAVFDDMAAGNEETARFLERAPAARGLVVVNPLDRDGSLAELERYAGDPRFVGAKTIQDDAHGLALDDPRFDPILERIARMPGWPLMAHPTGIGAAARKHPGVTFVSEHGTWRHRENADCRNMVFDLCTSTPLRAQTDIPDLIARAGADRVLYASDAPLMSPAFTMGKLASLDMDDAALAAILRGNALHAFPRLRLNAP